MTFPHTVLVGSIVIAMSAFSPQLGLGETPERSSKNLSESFSFNYSLATRGSHPNIPPSTRRPLSRPGLSNYHQNPFPKSLNTQSSSSENDQLQDEQGLISPSRFVEKEVPSYIIHEPALSHHDEAPQEVSNAVPPLTRELQATEQGPHDPQHQGFYTPIELPQKNNSQHSALSAFSRFDRPTIQYNYQLFSEENSSETLSQIPFVKTLTGLSNAPNSVSRFHQVFQPDWEPTDPSTFSEYGTIPLVINDAVDKNLRYFRDGITDRFQSYLDRFHHYKAVVEPIFREFGLPTELMYLSLVESGFNPKAFSRARASGPWQFMKATGRMYKLNVSWYVDERRDPIKSTVAAAHHLRDLYDRFGSWPLALAAYNAGSGKVSRAIRKTGTRDFWRIRRTWYLRRETKDYVPRFIAATLIAKNPTAYGFLEPDGDRHEFEEVLIGKPVQLAAITKQTGISLEELKRLNPELRRNIVPKAKGPGYHLKVPVGMATLVATHQSTFPVWTQPPPPPTQWYRVRRGDSLSVVARRFRMKVRQLKSMNNLRSNLIRVGTRLRVRGGDEDYADDQIIWYRVRYGDSLGKIADRFGTSVSKLKRLNKLSTHLIFPGDRLRVKGKPPRIKAPTGDSKWYRVQRGDSLWSIAQQFRVSVRDLRALNNLSTSIIRAGHMLMVSH